MSLSSFMFCKLCQKSDAKRDEGLTIPEDVEYVRDIRYGRNIKYHTLDICWPKGKTEKLPVIIRIHGGGYVYGNKKVYQFYAASLAGKRLYSYQFQLQACTEVSFSCAAGGYNLGDQMDDEA